MSVLYLALAIYIVGVAIVLYVRPSVMFHPDNGTWKEFGLDTSQRNTVFPFWMFTIVWAFISYALASVVLNSSPEDHIATPISEVRYTETPVGSQVVHTEAANISAPRVRAPRAPKLPSIATPAPALAPQLPGYYIVEPQASGIPRFVYFGHEPPTFTNLTTTQA
jgi:hypothetical protein